MNSTPTTRTDYDKEGYALIQELNGQHHGWWMVFSKDHVKKWERFYLFGKQNGPERAWDSNGVLIEERSFKDDVLDGSWKTFYNNGQLKNDAWFTAGTPDLFSKWYSKEGTLITELFIVQGVKQGTEIATIILDETTFETTKAIVTFEQGVYKGFEAIDFD